MSPPLLLLLLLCPLLLAPLASAACANGCSGHGTCGAGGVCSCFAGFTGAPDCSLRVCPTGPAWADKAYATDSAHSLSECSGAGVCDRSTGICECFEGYTGVACRRSACPNDCSGAGVCMTIQDAGLYLGSDYTTVAGSTGGDGMGPRYSNWDKDSIGVCSCDFGYFGPDCSRKMCPKADDPVTINQNSRRISLTLVSTGSALGGTLKVRYLGHTAEFDLGSVAGQSAAYCKQQWEKLDNVETVTCAVANQAAATLRSYNVTFDKFPEYPAENNFFRHTGNPALTAFTCDTSGVTVTGGALTACHVKDLVSTDVKEYEFCGRRGTCDFTSGLCYCFVGYTGADCTSPAYSTSSTNAEPALAATAVGNDYIGTALEIQAQKPASSDFKFLSCKADGTEVFSINGQGRITLGELMITTTGATISAGGLTITSGGQTITTGGLYVTNTLGGVNTLQVTASDAAMTKAVIAGYSATSGTSFNFIEAGASSASLVFKVRGDGKTTIAGGGLDVTGGAEILTGGLKVTDGGATITTTGHHHDGHALHVLQGAHIKNSRTNGTVMTLSANEDSHNGTALLINSDRAIGTNAYYSLLKTVINADADNAAAAQTIFRVTSLPSTEIVTGGLNVKAGGATIKAGGILVAAGGLTIAAGGLNVAGGFTSSSLTTFTGGFESTTAAATFTGGIHAKTTDVTIASGLDAQGLATFTGGLESTTAAATFTGGIHAKTTDVTLESGLDSQGLATFTGGV
ncbi:hypothetical protein TeGR_g3805, partial [Tetraparma gracilis]